jgi:hypothetical protein
MDAAHLAALKERHDFEAWRAPDPAQGAFLVWRHFLGGRELPGWRAHRIQRVEAPDTPPAHHSIWQRADGRGQILVAFDVYECASAAQAREFLVRVLAEFQTPLLERVPGIGEVAFTVPGEGAIVFARANLVLVLRNAGAETISLGDVARRFDENLRARPESGMPWEEAPVIARFEAGAARVVAGQTVPLTLDAPPRAGRAVWFKLFGPAGTFEIENDRPLFRPAAAGPAEILAYAIAADGAAAGTSFRLDVEEPDG